jgi:hypothetical protein
MRERKLIIAERANFYSSERIEAVAIKRLGMTLAERENVFFVKRTQVAAPFKVSNDNAQIDYINNSLR